MLCCTTALSISNILCICTFVILCSLLSAVRTSLPTTNTPPASRKSPLPHVPKVRQDDFNHMLHMLAQIVNTPIVQLLAICIPKLCLVHEFMERDSSEDHL